MRDLTKWLAIALVFLAGHLVTAQAAPTSTFKSQSNLVLVPTVVSDNSGYHIPRLKKDDFALTQDGKPQTIAVFEEVSSTPTAIHRARLPEGEFGNTLATGTENPRLAIIVLDTMHTPFEDQVYLRHQLIDYLASTLDSGQPLALISLSLSKFTVIHDFSSDPEVLIDALKRVHAHALEIAPDDSLGHVNSGLVRQEAQDLLDFRDRASERLLDVQMMQATFKTLEYLRQIAHQFSGIPGRKALIWVASAPPPLDERTMKMFSDAQIAIYPVDARGLVTPEYDTAVPDRPGVTRTAVQTRITANQDIILRFRQLADLTGGRAYFNRNDIKNSFHETVSDSSRYYVLGYYLRPNEPKPGWHKLAVKVNAPGAHVRARNGFVVPGDSDFAIRAKDEIRLALESPLDYTGLPFTVRLANQTGANGKTIVSYTINVPTGLNLIDDSDKNHLRLEITAVAINNKGETAAESSQRLDTHFDAASIAKIQNFGFTYENRLDVPSGVPTLKFVFRDALTGRIGTVTAPLKTSPSQ